MLVESALALKRQTHFPETAELDTTVVPWSSVTERPQVRGKFLYVGDWKFFVKGVTYGTFGPDADGDHYRTPELVRQDFHRMAENGINTIRTYTVPPRWLLDLAQDFGLRVMVGLPWEQHVAFLDNRGTAADIERRVRGFVRQCAEHPAILCYAVGNEIPASIVRWQGRKRVERFLHRLYRAVKEEDPSALVTYVNFPTTEYLRLPFLDLVCFNVYLESEETLRDYLARLQNLSDDRPLLMAEIGLDSRRNGDSAQSEVLSWQLRAAFEEGCCGAFLFAWTDEWWRGGHDIEDWDFGLVRRDGSAKPALDAVADAYAEAPFADDIYWPRASVVVCSYNGAATIRDTMEALLELDYPDYEVIVIDDGSTDHTAAIVSEYPYTLIRTENRGLSAARNLGMETATGQIVAYTDDDAYPDPDWLRYLVSTFQRNDFVGVGGPNLAPPGDGWIADCVAHAPGGPVHVLLSDRVAEHIPGCNMAFRREALRAIGGFDPRFRAAGDDVDVCWRLQQKGWTLGFSPSAVVWHHRRNSVRTYWKQQLGYGRAEALLEEKWPQKYNSLGHTTWGGRLYGKGLTLHVGAAHARVYQGVWGSALFQSIYEPAPNGLLSLPLMPEWYLLIAALAASAMLSLSWPVLGFAVPLLVLALALPLAQAVLSASRARFSSQPGSIWQKIRLYGVTAFMHIQQPVARLVGRLRHGLTPWRRCGGFGVMMPTRFTTTAWRETWQEPTHTLDRIAQNLIGSGVVYNLGGDFDHWDLEARGGALGRARLLLATEEHGGGKQLLRFRIWPRWNLIGAVTLAGISMLAVLAAGDEAWAASVLLGAAAGVLAIRSVYEAACAGRALASATNQSAPEGG